MMAAMAMPARGAAVAAAPFPPVVEDAPPSSAEPVGVVVWVKVLPPEVKVETTTLSDSDESSLLPVSLADSLSVPVADSSALDAASVMLLMREDTALPVPLAELAEGAVVSEPEAAAEELPPAPEAVGVPMTGISPEAVARKAAQAAEAALMACESSSAPQLAMKQGAIRGWRRAWLAESHWQPVSSREQPIWGMNSRRQLT
jgi:hypothetical protein